MAAILLRLQFFLSAVGLSVLFICVLYFGGFALNVSDSMEMGLYRKTLKLSIERGDIVASCLPVAIAQVALKRQYLPRGICPGGVAPVVKRVIAIPGDDVIVTQRIMFVGQRSYQINRVQYDRQGLSPLMIRESGRYLKTSFYWLLGESSLRSWDSRYFGGVPQQMILGVYKKFDLFTMKVPTKYWNQILSALRERLRSWFCYETLKVRASTWLSGVSTTITTPIFLRKISCPRSLNLQFGNEDRNRCDNSGGKVGLGRGDGY